LSGQVAGEGKHSTEMTLDCSMATDVGRVRRNNEDFVSSGRVLDATGRVFALWIVADGVGGGPRGEEASRQAVQVVIDSLSGTPWMEPAAAMSGAFSLASRRVHELTGTGASSTTMVAALVRESDGSAWIANVGDSRAYLISQGEARLVTEDHSLVAQEVAAGRMTADDARTAPGRNVVTRTIGSRPDVVVDVFGPRELGMDERLVLCTDGVHGMIDDEAIHRLASGPLSSSAAELVAAALEAGGRDNATALVGGYVPAPVESTIAVAATAGGQDADSGARLRGAMLWLVAIGLAAASGALALLLGAFRF
jgi:protein phosphatase